jgi:hypothetical protein
MSKRSRAAAKRPTRASVAPRPGGAASAPVPRSSPTRERVAAEARRGRRAQTLRRAGLGLAVAMGVVAIAWFALDLGRPHLGVEQRDEGGVGAHIADGAALPQRNRPPTSGPHYATRAPYGVTSSPVAPGGWIHALEHGGIVVLFKCSTDQECAQRAGEIEARVYARARPGAFGAVKLIATPYQDMDAPVTVAAWGRILPLQTVDAERILAFYDRYVDRGPENAP